jgi:hypothetical protein
MSRPTNVVLAGIATAITAMPRIRSAARRGSLAIAYPAQDATSVPIGTAIAATRRELNSCSRSTDRPTTST